MVSHIVKLYLSPETEMKCLQSLVNFIPVTISERKQTNIHITHLNAYFGLLNGDAYSQCHPHSRHFVNYPSVQTWWPRTPQNRSRRCWCSCLNSWWPHTALMDLSVPSLAVEERVQSVKFSLWVFFSWPKSKVKIQNITVHTENDSVPLRNYRSTLGCSSLHSFQCTQLYKFSLKHAWTWKLAIFGKWLMLKSTCTQLKPHRT